MFGKILNSILFFLYLVYNKMSCNNKIENNILIIFIQVIFMICFLVFFYFSYVVNIEKENFKKQIELTINSLLNESIIKNTITEYKNSKISKNDMYPIIFYGLIDTIEEKNNKQLQDSIKTINDNNNKIKNNCYILIGILLSIVFVISILLSCFPINVIIKESVIIILFIGLTELLFIKYISSRYIIADPNKIKKELGIAIKEWLKNNKH